MIDDPVGRVTAGLLLEMVSLGGGCDLSDMDRICDQVAREVAMISITRPERYKGASMVALTSLAAKQFNDLVRRGMLCILWGGNGSPYLRVVPREGLQATVDEMLKDVRS